MTVRTPSDLLVFQTIGTGRPKTCIFWKPDAGVVFGLPQHSSPNMTTIEVRLRQRRLILVSAYVEPENDISNTLGKLAVLFNDANGSLLCVGMDGNGHHPMWGCDGTNDRGEAIVDIAQAHDMVVCNVGAVPTFQALNHEKSVRSIVDITLASENLANLVTTWQVNLEAIQTSDHNAIDFTINAMDVHKATQRDTTYLFNNKTARWDIFFDSLSTAIEDSGLLECEAMPIPGPEIDHVVTILTDAITQACEMSMKRRGSFKPYNPFWTPELEQEKLGVIKKHHILQKYAMAKKPSAVILEAAKDHAIAKQKYAKAIGKASKENFRQFCCKQGKEDVWSLTNRLIKDAPRRTPPSMLKLGDGYTKDAQEASDALLDHFYPDDTNDTTAHHRELRRRAAVLSDAPDDPSFTTAEIEDALDTMNPNRAPGVDHFTSDICTAVFKKYPTLITNIMNSCLTTGRFPDAWKVAQVRILQKPGKDDYTNLSSFRPIGLLPVFGKLLEKLFVKRLTYRAQTTGTWSDRQYGFKEQKSTVTALNEVINKIKYGREKGLQVVAVSLDIKAAFDNAWWPVLMDGLRKTGCPRNIHAIIQDYLKRRTVRLQYGDAQSEKVMTKGCIQGSVCGPSFWNIILDDLLKLPLPDGIHIQAYADDVMLIGCGKSMAIVQAVLNDALQRIHAWGKDAKLDFSPTKTVAVAFTAASQNIILTMDGQPVTVASEIKLLGVIIDSRLSFIKHAKYVISKVTKIFKNICKYVRPTWGVHSANVEIIYRHVIEPTVTYAAGIWGTATKYDLVRRLLRSFQRSYAIRAIRGFHTVSAVSALALAQFTPLHLKVDEVYKIEQVKLTEKFDGLPDDSQLESRVRPENLLHPADRLAVLFDMVETQAQADAVRSPINIYTDGSKLESGKTGCAVVILNDDKAPETHKYKLADHCTVYQAEMYALYQAVLWITKKSNGRHGRHQGRPHLVVTIYSDSRSSLEALQDRSHNSPLGVAIHKMLAVLSSDGHKVNFAWVKAHVGIDGNEAADAAAKDATTKHSAMAYTAFPISYAKRCIKTVTLETWRQEYSEAVTGSTTRSFLPTLDDALQLRAAVDLTFELTQVLTGHNFSKSYLKKFKIIDDDICPCDGHTPQTLTHLLEDCPRYGHWRRAYHGHCDEAGVRPDDMTKVVQSEFLMDSFVNFTHKIITTLKDFNST